MFCAHLIPFTHSLIPDPFLSSSEIKDITGFVTIPTPKMQLMCRICIFVSPWEIFHILIIFLIFKFVCMCIGVYKYYTLKNILSCVCLA